jgi:hypothetical protein
VRIQLDSRAPLLVSGHLAATSLLAPPRARLRLQTADSTTVCLDFADPHALHLVAAALWTLDQDCRATLRARRPKPLPLDFPHPF